MSAKHRPAIRETAGLVSENWFRGAQVAGEVKTGEG